MTPRTKKWLRELKQMQNIFISQKWALANPIFRTSILEHVKARIHCETFLSERFMKYSFGVIL